jgi:Na+/proline symporter
MSYLATFVIVTIGISFGFVVDTINDVMQWLFGALFGGYTAANLLKWHWWRFNSYGFFWGMMSGLLASLVFPVAFPALQPLYAFPYILALSLIGSIAGTFATVPDEEQVLLDFYRKVRPWGFWQPIAALAKAEDPNFEENKDTGRDLFNVVIGTLWQITLVIIPIYLVIREFTPMLIAIACFIVTSWVLKKNWLDKLKD